MHRADKTHIRTTTIPYKEWSFSRRIIEKLYRFTHNGQIRTLVINKERYDNNNDNSQDS